MSIFRPISPRNRGAEHVGLLQELPALERSVVIFLRNWCEGEAHRAMLERDCLARLGADMGARDYSNFARLMRLCILNARRPLLRHGLACPCVGADEHAFAQMIGAAAAWNRDGAVELAGRLVESSVAWEVALLAEGLGRMFLRFARSDLQAGTTGALPPNRTLH